jgi:hypothetical protein
VVEPHPAVAGDGEVGHGSRWSSTSSTIVGATRSRRRSLPPLHPLWRHQPRAITIHSPPPPPPSSGQHSHLRAHRPPGSRRCQGAGGGGYFRWDVREGRRSPWAWEVICHPKWRRIQRGQLCWRATPAKVVNMCHFRNIEGKYIFDTAKVIIKEWSSVIMLKS